MTFRASRPVALVLVVAFAVTGCAQLQETAQATKAKVQDNPKAVLGSVAGAATGAGIAALAGGNAWWIVGSALAGAALGGYVGHRLDERDRRLAAEAAVRAFEQNRTGQPSAWKNPDSGNRGSITPVKTYQIQSGQYCREYREEIYIGKERQQAYGTACRQPDGTWRVES